MLHSIAACPHPHPRTAATGTGTGAKLSGTARAVAKDVTEEIPPTATRSICTLCSNGVMRRNPAGTVVTNVLAGAAWECWSCRPDAVVDPRELAVGGESWIPASVPGTAASALRSCGQWKWGDDDREILDGSDWWYRCHFDLPGGDDRGTWELECGGLATIADVWFNGEHLLHSENMWLTHQIRVDHLEARNVLLLRFAALDPLLARRRPRPRWRSLSLRAQSQRWYRTTLLGRIPGWGTSGAPVGPWRPLRLHRIDNDVSVRERRLVAQCDGDDGVVEARLVLDGIDVGADVEIRVGDERKPLVVLEQDGDAVVEAEIRLAGIERWWPHTHGPQPSYPVRLVAGGREIDVAVVGFRTVSVDRDDGRFAISVNEVPIFCRGACWVPPDAVALNAAPDAVRASLHKLVEAGMNMVRILGHSAYEDDEFWDACDQLGIMVWQDCMLSSFDPPEDPEFLESLGGELRQQFGDLQGRPALTVLCGSSDIHQQAAMFGLPLDRWRSPVIEETIPALAEQILPGTPYVVSAPTGGDLPFDPAEGVASYFGVGAYLRPVSDVRSAGVRFAAECLAFATPPEPATVDRVFGTTTGAGHHPDWKVAVPRDSAASWDFDDIRDEYVRQIFGVDPFRVRYSDPDRALDYGRAAVAHLMSTVLTEWRCRRSGCTGALILDWQDTGAGAGWGLLDAFSLPKAPWFALRRVLAPVAPLLTDDGLSGLGIHVVNDGPGLYRGQLRLSLFDMSGVAVEEATAAIEVPGRSQRQWSTAVLLDGFRDLTNAYRFGPPAYDVVRVALDVDGVTSEAIHLPCGAGRPVEADLGLEATAWRAGDDWQVTVRTRRFAQWVAFDTPDFLPNDSWFHLAPGGERSVTLRALDGDGPLKGRVRALNGLHPVPIFVEG
jgi:beta-mannosidase